MSSASAERNRVLYVVMGWPRRMTNDRVAKILTLRPHFDDLVLVTRGSEPADEGVLAVRGIPNPLGWLRRAGLHGLRRALERVLFFPNSHVLFTSVAKRKLKQRIQNDLKEGRSVTVLVCVPNHENTSVGLYLKTRFPEIRWVMDWQDLWTYDQNYFEGILPIYRRWVRNRERQVLDTADLHVTTNGYACEVLHQRYDVPSDRLLAINHHFDRRQLKPANVHRPFAGDVPIRIGFLGSMFKPPRVPGFEFMQTLRQLRQRGVDIQLHLHGRLPPEVQRRWHWLEESGLVLEQRVPHRECVKVLSQYDYLLLLLADLPNSRAVMSIKLPQYLLARRPILALVPEVSAVADIVTRSGTGMVIPSGGDWLEGLTLGLQSAKLRRMESIDEDYIERFSWDRLSGRWLEALMAGAVSTSRGRGGTQTMHDKAHRMPKSCPPEVA